MAFKKKDPGYKKPMGKKGFEAGRGARGAIASKARDETDLKKTRKAKRGDT